MRLVMVIFYYCLITMIQHIIHMCVGISLKEIGIVKAIKHLCLENPTHMMKMLRILCLILTMWMKLRNQRVCGRCSNWDACRNNKLRAQFTTTFLFFYSSCRDKANSCKSNSQKDFAMKHSKSIS